MTNASMLAWATPVLAPKVSFLKIPQSLANQDGGSPYLEPSSQAGDPRLDIYIWGLPGISAWE